MLKNISKSKIRIYLKMELHNNQKKLINSFKKLRNNIKNLEGKKFNWKKKIYS